VIGRLLVVLGLIPTLASSSPPGWSGSSEPGKPERVSQELLALHETYGEAQRRGAAIRSDNPLLRIVDDRVLVDAVAAGDVRALEADLVALGMRNTVALGRFVSGELPIASIPALGTLGSLAFARPSALFLSPGPGAPPHGP
jgi:hypothetical protein